MRVYTRCAELRQPFSPPGGIARLARQASLARTQCVFFGHDNYDLSWFTLTEVVATSRCGLLHLVSTCTVGVRTVYKPDHHTISLCAFHSNLWLLLGFFTVDPATRCRVLIPQLLLMMCRWTEYSYSESFLYYLESWAKTHTNYMSTFQVEHKLTQQLLTAGGSCQ